jgi:hypothetical protein
MSSVVDISLDRSFWPGKQGPFAEHATAFWRFSTFREVEKLVVFVNQSGTVKAHAVHISHAPILAFLDYSLRHYIGMAEAGNKGRRIAHYLQQLCKGIENEMANEDENNLVLETWRSMVLQPWAVRTGEGFSHSDAETNAYLKHCVDKNTRPYSKDVIKSYGKHSSQDRHRDSFHFAFT